MGDWRFGGNTHQRRFSSAKRQRKSKNFNKRKVVIHGDRKVPDKSESHNKLVCEGERPWEVGICLSIKYFLFCIQLGFVLIRKGTVCEQMWKWSQGRAWPRITSCTAPKRVWICPTVMGVHIWEAVVKSVEAQFTLPMGNLGNSVQESKSLMPGWSRLSGGKADSYDGHFSWPEKQREQEEECWGPWPLCDEESPGVSWLLPKFSFIILQSEVKAVEEWSKWIRWVGFICLLKWEVLTRLGKAGGGIGLKLNSAEPQQEMNGVPKLDGMNTPTAICFRFFGKQETREAGWVYTWEACLGGAVIIPTYCAHSRETAGWKCKVSLPLEVAVFRNFKANKLISSVWRWF